MRKPISIGLVTLIVVSVLIGFSLWSDKKVSQNPKAAEPAEEVVVMAPQKESGRGVTPPAVHSDSELETSSNSNPVGGDVSPEMPKGRSTAHGPVDFKKGQLENLVVADDCLRMGADTSFVSRLEPTSFFGVYISPEQKFEKTFDSVVVNLDAEIDEGSSLLLEFRIKAPDGAWSEWLDLSASQLNELILTPSVAESLQYRITLYAREPATNPRVKSVRVETRDTREV